MMPTTSATCKAATPLFVALDALNAEDCEAAAVAVSEALRLLDAQDRDCLLCRALLRHLAGRLSREQLHAYWQQVAKGSHAEVVAADEELLRGTVSGTA